MPYADLDDVRGLLAKSLSNGTDFGDAGAPTEVQAEAIIASVSAEIDVVLAARGITVPVTEPAYFLSSLLPVNAHGAAARILRSWFPDAVGPGEQPAYAYWQALYDGAIEAMKDGSMIPPGAPTSGQRVVAATHLTEYPDEDPDLGEQANPAFTRGKVW